MYEYDGSQKGRQLRLWIFAPKHSGITTEETLFFLKYYEKS